MFLCTFADTQIRNRESQDTFLNMTQLTTTGAMQIIYMGQIKDFDNLRVPVTFQVIIFLIFSLVAFYCSLVSKK